MSEENNYTEEIEVITLKSEDGEEIDFIVDAEFDYEDRHYLILTDDEESEDSYLFFLEEDPESDEEELIIREVEDEAEFERVSEFYYNS